jgi:hypothetical protein
LPIILSLALAAMAAGAGSAAARDDIDRHRWRDRVLVVLAPSEADAELAEQRRSFRATAGQNRERDLVLIEGIGDTAQAESLRRRFGVPTGTFRAILVGKDGGAKILSERSIAPERLFAEIDSMPMRQDEMKRRGQK